MCPYFVLQASRMTSCTGPHEKKKDQLFLGYQSPCTTLLYNELNKISYSSLREWYGQETPTFTERGRLTEMADDPPKTFSCSFVGKHMRVTYSLSTDRFPQNSQTLNDRIL